MVEIEHIEAPLSERLWRQHAAELMRFATVLVGPSDAHDVVVDAFLRGVQAVGAGAVDNERAYLFRAVANRALDLRRSRDRQWRRDLASVGPAAEAEPDSFVDVRRAVASLSVRQRAVVYFVYWDDRTEQETAELLGVSPGTVRRHLVRARTHLRKGLQ